MASPEKTYIAIDLKSFYASVECAARGLDPLNTHLVVADASRTEKTICLAVSPSLKAYGIPGRARLFEVVERVKALNGSRLQHAPGRCFTGSSHFASVLAEDASLALDYIVATPRMALYMEVSARIYEIYLRHISPEDIHVYSIDEVFIDATRYLSTNACSARELTMRLVREVLRETGITATAGIGSNLYLCKVAMDIVAKHIPPDADGVRIAQLDEYGYRKQLWDHRPITDFWRVGAGYARKLAANGMFTMGDVARCSIAGPNSPRNEELLYRLFGVNAELLIDHAWGWESCTIEDIKAYRPAASSISSGQVLTRPYSCPEAKLIVREMTDLLVLDLVSKRLVTDRIGLALGYDSENLHDPALCAAYTGPVVCDHYGKPVPRPAHGGVNLGRFSSSTKQITEAMMALFDRLADPRLSVRRVTICAEHVLPENAVEEPCFEQLDLFTDYAAEEARLHREQQELARERRRQEAILAMQRKYGRNAVLKGMNLSRGATSMERNRQIGGHKA